MTINIAVAQFNPIVGDLDGNFERHKSLYLEAALAGADILVFPEFSLVGYPLEDLVLRPSFLDEVRLKTEQLFAFVEESGQKTTLIFGAPYLGANGIINAAFVSDPIGNRGEFDGINGEASRAVIGKTELPNYGVFDEKRLFTESPFNEPIEWRGHALGIMICEDTWFERVAEKLRARGAELIISINGSPYEVGKNVVRRQVVANRIKETGLPLLYVNAVGGQDELVFDGGSFFYDGIKLWEAPHFQEGLFLTEFEFQEGTPRITLDNYPQVEPSGVESIYQATVLGLRDYMRKQGFTSVVLGMSGGVDSGIVAAIACDAIGGNNVNLVMLPSKFSSEGSVTDSIAASERLGAKLRAIPIEGMVEQIRLSYSSATSYETVPAGIGFQPVWRDGLKGTADENIQARARGLILMAISNNEGPLLLSTGNKSEVSVGYATLYGDMAGGFNPIKDCYKTTVWDLCRYRNDLTEDQIKALGFLGNATEVVPEAIIVKPPSAELRADQKDSDSLPPYPVLDAILVGMIERERSIQELVDEGFDRATLVRIRNLVDGSEYKRRQSAPGIKITSKLYGRDRRYPIVNKWRA